MPSTAKQSFDSNKQDVDQLWQIHEEVAGQGTGRKHGVDVLNRCAIVFVTACWESFIEDLAKEGFDFLLANAPNAMVIPAKVRTVATNPMFEQKDTRKVWDLADGGWKTVLQNHRNATFAKWVDTLNTPKTTQVNSLYEELLGINQISSHWHWQNMTAEQAAKKLDDFITIRGNIAHRTQHDETVYKNWGTDYLKHVESLVERTETAVCNNLTSVTGASPW